LVEALVEQGSESSILTLDYPWEGLLPTTMGMRIMAIRRGRLTRLFGGWCPELRRQLRELAGEGLEVIHNHGLWLFPNLYARQTACERNLPLVISPRGMLEGWSLRRSRAKKWLVWHLMEKRNLLSAAAFHATSAMEADSIRRLGFGQPVAVIPNGVDIPEGSAPSREVLEQRFPELRGKKWLSFMSRLHPKKGLLELARVWGSLAPEFPDWRLVIAGRSEGGFQREVRAALVASGGDRSAVFVGSLHGDDKSAALANSELFVLPTHSENFGIVVAEALAHGCPAVVTKGAPWSELVSEQCGWWIDRNDAALSRTLTEAMTLDEAERKAMGGRGRRLIAERYTWQRAAARMRELYMWLLGRSEQPACIATQL
jgi:glycosyltransferase involved in cell wall biosynthesis